MFRVYINGKEANRGKLFLNFGNDYYHILLPGKYDNVSVEATIDEEGILHYVVGYDMHYLYEKDQRVLIPPRAKARPP